ncbi:MAG: HAD-IC family P-type ATPase, partial [Candidatus Shapirobacteria bacterium]|nr:HAD-IC family P-type ATPase [Candidatus Shapirobacteria bacterium]
NELVNQEKTVVEVKVEGKLVGQIGMNDTIKDGVLETILSLHKRGIKVFMLTGDNKRAAEFVAKKVGIDEVIAEVLPSQKSEKIKELQEKGLKVAMVGDGINDAPALVQSEVGMAMATGSDIAIESAGITILGGDIKKVATAIELSKATMTTVKENLFWAFIYNMVGIPLASGLLYPVLGIRLNPIFAGMAMALSSVSVVSNSLRLKIKKLK